MELHAPAEQDRVHALLFLCGLKFLLTYREANGRRLSHYLDDGLREAVEHTLPVLMNQCAAFQPPRRSNRRVARCEVNDEFQHLRFGFRRLHRRLPACTAKWVEAGEREAGIVRISFGMGIVARFAPESHPFVREMLEKPLVLSVHELDVLESFRWHPEWSLVLTR